MLVLIWVQTFCKDYRQMTKVTASKQKVKNVKRYSVTVQPHNFYAPDKSAYWKIIFFIAHPKHMLWVLNRTVSMTRFF